ncbi:GntR family transcriptional regulator [Mangrovicoccus ximenensis]|uniref:GntR family transcriptional regulator n=1 Tax=Mangrovicoccus ximenensis TaxID=1911570 RepID=UPI000D3478A1|nr:winged helix-turn-helix domain-containing protein [Mangrovicoccus ximenensis]
MSHWPLTKDDIARPAYRSLAQGIAAAIEAGRLRAGDRLPPHRDMAWRLGVSVQTVSRAYEELIRADLVSGEVGRGSFVKTASTDVAAMPWHRPGGGVPSPAAASSAAGIPLPPSAARFQAWTFRAGHRLRMQPGLPGKVPERIVPALASALRTAFGSPPPPRGSPRRDPRDRHRRQDARRDGCRSGARG